MGIHLEKCNLTPVRRDLSIEEHSEAFTIGDIDLDHRHGNSKVLAQLDSVALQSDKFAGANIEYHRRRQPHQNRGLYRIK